MACRFRHFRIKKVVFGTNLAAGALIAVDCSRKTYENGEVLGFLENGDIVAKVTTTVMRMV